MTLKPFLAAITVFMTFFHSCKTQNETPIVPKKVTQLDSIENKLQAEKVLDFWNYKTCFITSPHDSKNCIGESKNLTTLTDSKFKIFISSNLVIEYDFYNTPKKSFDEDQNAIWQCSTYSIDPFKDTTKYDMKITFFKEKSLDILASFKRLDGDGTEYFLKPHE